MEMANAPRKGSLFRKQNQFAGRTLTPIMLYMIFFTIIPMLWGILITFFRYSPTRAGGGFLGLGGANPFVGLENYLDLFNNTPTGIQFRISLKNTLIFSLLYLPLNLLEPLLRRDRGDVVAEHRREPPRLGDVTVQRVRLVLREHRDLAQVGVGQVTQHEVDESVGAAERDRGLCPVGGEGHEPLALAAGEDQGQNLGTLDHAPELIAFYPAARANPRNPSAFPGAPEDFGWGASRRRLRCDSMRA